MVEAFQLIPIQHVRSPITQSQECSSDRIRVVVFAHIGKLARVVYFENPHKRHVAVLTRREGLAVAFDANRPETLSAVADDDFRNIEPTNLLNRSAPTTASVAAMRRMVNPNANWNAVSR